MSATDLSAPLEQPPEQSADRHITLSSVVSQAIDAYFAALDGHDPADLYRMVLAEVERPLLEAVLHQAQGNQCRAAAFLGISRGTLRKKLKEYGVG